jgi:hypothetical protein
VIGGKLAAISQFFLLNFFHSPTLIPLSEVGTTCFSSCCDLALIFTIGHLPVVNPSWQWSGCYDCKCSRDQRLNVPSEAFLRARDNKFWVTHPMTDQRCLTSTIARRSALTAGPSRSSTMISMMSYLCLFSFFLLHYTNLS